MIQRKNLLERKMKNGFRKKVGKNLFNNTFKSSTSNGVELIMQDEKMIFKGTSTANAGFRVSMKIPEECIGEIVTLTIFGFENSNFNNAGFKRISDGSNIAIITAPANSITFLVTQDIYDNADMFHFYLPSGRTVNDEFTIQLELGKVSTDFEAHKITTPISLDNTIENPIRDLMIYGNSEQETSEMGSNIFDGVMAPGNLNYDTGVEEDSDSRIRSVNYIDITGATNVTIVSENTFSEMQSVGIRFYDENYNCVGKNSSAIMKKSVTMAVKTDIDPTAIVKYCKFVVTITDTSTMFAVNIDGSTEYTPFIPNSPSPEYPSEIESCGDEGYIEVSACGKNKYDLTKYPFVRSVAYVNGISNTWGDYSGITKYFPVEPEETYTFSNNLNVKMAYGLVFYDEERNILSYINTGVSTFTTPKKCEYIRFSIKSTVFPDWVQIEQGSIATEYEPYRETTINFPLTEPLRKVNDIEDYIDWKNRQVVRNIYSIILDGSENWNSTEAYTGYYRYRFTPALISLKGTTIGVKGINTHYNQRTWESHGGYEYLYVQSNGTGGNIYIQSDRYTTLEKLTNYLTEQYNVGTPVKIIFVGTVPTYEPFTEEQNAIADLILTPNYCNITSSNKIKPSKIEFSYKSKVK